MMPYQVELREEINTLISYVSPESPTNEELQHYLDEVVRLQDIVIQNNSSRLYHIIVIEPRRYNYVDGLHVIRAVQQNKALNTYRKQLNIRTLLVGQTPKSLQIMMTMMTRTNTGGHQVAVFQSLEPALEFVRADNASSQQPISE
jgi:hypothetical protein